MIDLLIFALILPVFVLGDYGILCLQRRHIRRLSAGCLFLQYREGR